MSSKFKKSKVFTISFAHFAHDIYSSFLAPLLPLLIEKLGMSLTMAALLDIARRIPSLFNPLFGLIAEKTGVKYFVILTPAITALSMCLIGLVNSYVLLFILLFVAGISGALFHIPSPTMIKDNSGEKTGTGMSFFMVGGELARTIGPLIATAGVSWWGLEGIYRLLPIGFIASLILYVKLKDYEATRPPRKPLQKGDTKKVLKEFTPFFLSLGFFMLFQAGLKSALTLYLPVYLTQQGESLLYAGISLAILQGFGVAGALMLGSISDKFGRKNTLLLSSSALVLFMGLFLYFKSIFLIPFIGFFLLSSGPVLMALVQDTNSNMPTFMNSMYMSINFGASSLIVFCVGVFGDNFGLESTYMIFTLVAIGCMPAIYFMDKTANQSS